MGRFTCRTLLLFCLAGTMTAALLPVVSAGVLPKDSAEQYELTFWESIKSSSQAGDYEAYLQAYPQGRFAGLARSRIERLRGRMPRSRAPAAPAGEDADPAAAGSGSKSSTGRTRTPKTERTHTGGASGTHGNAEAGTPASAPAPGGASSTVPQPDASMPAKPTLAKITEITDCSTCPVLIALPAGDFTMGSNSTDPTERPAFHMQISHPFAIGKYEVTVGQWTACIDAGACPRVTGDASRKVDEPARNLSWDDAQLYLAWLSKTTGKAYRLATEAEWEYAARGGTSTRYWWGQQMATGKANCKECGEPWQADTPARVGSFSPNPFGLYDMNGSVWEWASDCWHSSYQRSPSDGRSWEEPDCRVRVLRGGSWREGASYMPVTTRFKYDASVRQSQNGFRVARNIQ